MSPDEEFVGFVTEALYHHAAEVEIRQLVLDLGRASVLCELNLYKDTTGKVDAVVGTTL